MPGTRNLIAMMETNASTFDDREVSFLEDALALRIARLGI
jgi:hypothetical protein